MTLQNPFERRNKGLLSIEEERAALKYASLRSPKLPIKTPEPPVPNPKKWRDKAAQARKCLVGLEGHARDAVLEDIRYYESKASSIAKGWKIK